MTATRSAQATAGVPADVEIELRARRYQAQILPGRVSNALSYRARLLSGSADSLADLPDGYLGPIINVRKRQRLRVTLVNELREPTNIHWHGLRVPPEMDGLPLDMVAAGDSFAYEFEVIDRAGPYWFHPHPNGRTGFQVYGGLAGLLFVRDEEEEALGWPGVLQDLPLVIQDRLFDRSNQLIYLPMMGNEWLGDTVLVNGRPDYSSDIERRPYRLRVYNASNARAYKLGWRDGSPLMVIGTDSGLLSAPARRDYVLLAPAERVDLWLDGRQYDPGTELELLSLGFDAGHSGMMGGMGGGMMGGAMTGGLANGAPLSLLRLRVTATEGGSDLQLPPTLSRLERPDVTAASNAGSPRRFILSRQNMQWTINGRAYQPDVVDANEQVRLGNLDLWQFENQDTMAHPMHIHGAQWQIVERGLLPGAGEAAYESVRQGYVDEGLKDGVMVMPGERVRLALRFGPYTGRYLYHCHILEHEDAGMMRHYEIAGGTA
ncbi:MAG: multicopper oxidase family protein [Anaerolineae bacterium]